MKYSGRHVGVIPYGCFDRTGQFEGSRRLFAVGYSSGDGHARIGVERPFHRHQLYGNFRSSGPLARMNVEASSTANDWPGAHLPPQTPYRALSTKSDTSPVYHSSHLPNIHLPLITRMGGRDCFEWNDSGQPSISSAIEIRVYLSSPRSWSQAGRAGVEFQLSLKVKYKF